MRRRNRSLTKFAVPAAAIAALLLTGAAEAPTVAQDEPSAITISPEARGVTQAVTAAELAAWGRRRQDAGALVMAARLLAEVPVRQSGDQPALFSPLSLLDEAAAMAPDNPGLIDAVERLRDPLLRGVQSSPFGAGPVFTVKQLKARENWSFEVEARGNEVLRVAAIGDGDTNIDLTVTDARGEVMCRDRFGDHYPVCTVAPRQSGAMRVDVVNRGDLWTKVQVLSN